MAASRRRVTGSERLIDQLAYWRKVRLDCPDRKQEALRHIDNLLDEWLRKGNKNGS